MKILLFLGSGVSIPSGMPRVADIDESLLSPEWYHHSDGIFYPKCPEATIEYGIRADRVQGFLRVLKAETRDYFNSRREPEASYEDLYYICCQIRDEVTNELFNPVAREFVKVVRRQINHLLTPGGILEGDVGISQIVESCLTLIESVAWNKLSNAKPPEGLKLISDLAVHSLVERLDICTLNHDLLIETQLKNNHVKFADGFGSLDGDFRWFEATELDSLKHHVRLLKLHGSVNWWKMESLSDESSEMRLTIPSGGKQGHDRRDAQGNVYKDVYGKPELLCGTYNKLTEYLYGAFAEIRLRFIRSLNECELVVMSGYGWNDRGINAIFSQWFRESASHRIVLLHENPESIRSNSRSFMWHRFDDLVKRQQLILEPHWLKDTQLDRLLNIIENARKLPVIKEKRSWTFDELWPD